LIYIFVQSTLRDEAKHSQMPITITDIH